jgi:hypothetical protein
MAETTWKCWLNKSSLQDSIGDVDCEGLRVWVNSFGNEIIGYCPNLDRNAGFESALEPPRWRRYGCQESADITFWSGPSLAPRC